MISDVNIEVINVNINMEYKVESFFRGIDFGFEIVEVEVNLRNSVLEGNLGVRFD